MVRRLVVACAWLAGCGDNLPPATIEDDILAQLDVHRVGVLRPDDQRSLGSGRGIALAALDDHTIAIVRATGSGDTFCPACVGVDPAQCPAICRRTRITVQRHDVLAPPGAPITVTQVFPRSVDHAVGGVDIVSLGGGRVGVSWLDCDNATCVGAISSQSCDARYATVDLGTLELGAIATLYERRFGDLQLAHDPRSGQLLALTGKQIGSGAGLRAAIYDAAATTELAPWTPLGGTSSRAATATATADGFVIVADDRSPGDPTPAEPCAAACDCLAGGPIDLEAGGLYAFHVGGRAPRTVQIAPGKSHDGGYATREVIAAIAAGDRVIVATGQSADRSAELFEATGGSWHRRLVSRAPLPQWIGVLGDARHLAWIGSEAAGTGLTLQRLVAGVIDGATATRGELEPAVDGRVFEAVPVATPAGVTRTFLLRGVAPSDGGVAQGWDRFELIEVRAAW